MFISWLTRIAVLIAFSMAFFSCSSSGGDIPTSPGPFTQEEDSADATAGMPDLPVTAPGHHMAGIFDLEIDLGNGVIDVSPLRESAAHFNATALLMPPNCYDCVSIEITDHSPEARIIKANVFIRNPSNFTVYDVRGILMTNQDGWKLVNRYGYTPLYDDGPPILYNPYREFYWGHESHPDFSFWPDSLRVQEYVIQYPEEPDFAGLKYVVDVSWPGLCAEPYRFEIEWPGTIDPLGGKYTVQCITYDHQKNESSVLLDASPIGAGNIALEITHQSSSKKYWEGELNFPGVEFGIPPGNYQLTAYAFSDIDLPVIQLVDVIVSPIKAPNEITPPMLNIDPMYIHTRGSTVFIGSREKVLLADISDPSTPVYLGSVDLRRYDIQSQGILVGDNAVVVKGDYVPFGGVPAHDDKFAVIDISDPTNLGTPVIFNLPNSNHYYYSYMIKDGYLIVINNSPASQVVHSIRVYDIDPPSEAFLALNEPIQGNFYPRTSCVVGDKLYIFCYGQLLIYQLDSSPSLVLKGSVPIEGATCNPESPIAGGYAYTSNAEMFNIYDIDPPETAHFVSQVDAGVYITSFFTHKSFAYAFGDSYETSIIPIDITEPATPEVSGQFESVFNHGINIWGKSGDIVYATGQISLSWPWQAVVAFDLSNPSEPVWHLWECQYSSIYKDCALIGNRLLLPCSNLGIISLDVSEPEDMHVVEEFWTICDPEAVAVRDSVGYVLEREGLLKVIDLSPPGRGRIVKVLPGWPYKLDFAFGSLSLAFWNDYLVASINGYHVDNLYFYDITDPLNPELITGYDDVIGFLDLEGDLGITYGGNRIYPFVVSSPTDIEFLEDVKKEYRSAALSNGSIFGVTNNVENHGDPIIPELRILDPFMVYPNRLKKVVSLPGEVFSIAVSGDYAYVSDDLTGIDILRINPWDETEIIGFYETHHLPGRVFSKGALIMILYGFDYYYSMDGWELLYRDQDGGLHPVAFFDIPNSDLKDVTINQGCIYVCDKSGGLYIYEAW